MISVPSLQHVSMVKLAVSIYNHRGMRDYIEECSGHRFDARCIIDYCGQFIRENMPNWAPPKFLLEKTLCFLRPIHDEFRRWRHFHRSDLGLDFGDLDIIYWKCLGSIDYLETAKRLVCCEKFTLWQRFSVACFYWLTNDVVRLWEGASPSEKKTLIKQNDSNSFRGPNYRILKKWISWLRDGAVRERLFSYVYELINLPVVIPPPIEIWRELTPESLKNLQRKIVRCKIVKNIGFDNFSRMDTNLQIELFKENPHSALIMYLRWPLQTEFLEMANRLYSFINGETFLELLHYIISCCKREQNQHYFDYKELVRSFWLQSPENLKKDVGVMPEFLSIQNHIF
ncbi:uncharacterized protein NPIL_319851 [Nephila pilipes]|uniref:Uncharacterized protein n=1 Tax=Nephila pilipes TaxID=299642 RepID=A0A8X6UJG7_NEPPI|nr:uncharacterized protein NPIL_319851 [Nephila pilipes]